MLVFVILGMHPSYTAICSAELKTTISLKLGSLIIDLCEVLLWRICVLPLLEIKQTILRPNVMVKFF